MKYKDTINYLYYRLPMFQRTGPAAYKNSLDNTVELDNLYQNPHKKFRSIHIAGTNGKGSVAHMLASVLQESGYKTGLYTSPHLKDFRERIRINGKMIGKQEVSRWVEKFQINNESWKIEPSFFELTVVMAFDFFARHNVDIAVVEVGLGGRLDSTNIITPEASVITNIGLDHTALLGDAIEKIAVEKAGIIKTKIPVVIGTTQEETAPVFLDTATKKKVPVFFADQEYRIEYAMKDLEGKMVVHVEKLGEMVFPDLKLELTGLYQLKNLPAVLKTVEILKNKGWNVSKDMIYRGLGKIIVNTGLQGRWQVIDHNPLIVCDTGHNEDGIREVFRQVQQIPRKKLHVVFGLVDDKDPGSILQWLPREGIYYYTKADIPRAMNENKLAGTAAKYGLTGRVYSSVKEAFKAARENSGIHDLIVIGGSTFVVAEVL